MKNKPQRDYTQDEFFNCYSRKLMYWLGLHGINYLDKFHDVSGRPMWRFANTEEFRTVLAAWDDFKNNNLGG